MAGAAPKFSPEEIFRSQIGKSQIQDLYSFAVSSECDNLYCRVRTLQKPRHDTLETRGGRRRRSQQGSPIAPLRKQSGAAEEPRSRCSHRCERGTLECVRYFTNALELLANVSSSVG